MDIETYRHQLLRWWNHKRALVFIGRIKQQSLQITFKKFTGVRTLFRTYKTEAFTIRFSPTMTEGEVALFAINQAQEIIQVIEGTQTLSPGRYRFRLLGQSASGTLQIAKE